MTDIYTYHVRSVEEDCIHVDLYLVYPDAAGECGGHLFAKNLLWSIVSELNQPDHPYLKALAQYPEARASYFIRNTFLLSEHRDEEEAQALAAFTYNGRAPEGSTEWCIGIRVRVEDWLEGIAPGQSDATSASESINLFSDDNWDCNDGSDPDGFTQYAHQRLAELYGAKQVPEFLKEWAHRYYACKPCFLLGYDRLFQYNDYPGPYLPMVTLPDYVSSEVDYYWELEEGVYIGFGDACFFKPDHVSSWYDALVLEDIRDDHDGWLDYSELRIYENIGHYLSQCFEVAITKATDDDVMHQMLLQDQRRLNEWIARHYDDRQWSEARAQDKFFQWLERETASPRLLESLLSSYGWHYDSEPPKYDATLMARVFQLIERHRTTLLDSILGQGQREIDYGEWFALMHLHLEQEHIDILKQYLDDRRSKLDDDELNWLCCILVKGGGVDMVPFILSTLEGEDVISALFDCTKSLMKAYQHYGFELFDGMDTLLKRFEDWSTS